MTARSGGWQLVPNVICGDEASHATRVSKCDRGNNELGGDKTITIGGAGDHARPATGQDNACLR